jgi:hypothetical protein
MKTDGIFKLSTPIIRVVNNISVIVQGIEELDYSGKWMHAGYNIALSSNNKKIGETIGWPTNSDIYALLNPS